MALKFVGKSGLTVPLSGKSKPQLTPHPFAPAVMTESEPVSYTVTVPVVSSAPMSTNAALTAEYIGLHLKCEEYEVKPILKRMEEIRKTLMTEANYHASNTPVVFTSNAGTIEFSERIKVTEIPDPLTLVAHLQMKFGGEVAASVVEIGLTQLRKILSPVEIQQFAVEIPGGRKIQSVKVPK